MTIMLSQEPEYVEPLRHFLRQECTREVVRAQDVGHEPPLGLLRRLGELGYLRIGLEPEWDGVGDFTDATRVMEEIGRFNLALGHLAGRALYGIQALRHYGTDEQQRRLIPLLASGEGVFSIAFTEPDVGSDAASIRTRARLETDEWVISGEKVFASSFAYARLAMVSVRTDPDAPGRDGISILLVDPRADGISCQRLDTLGDWSVGTYRVFFDDVRVPRDAVFGGESGGWRVISGHLVRERAIMSARAIGATAGLLDDTAEYVSQRVQFGHALADHQAVQHKLADIRIQLRVARAALYELAAEEATGAAVPADAAAVKVFATEMYLNAANTCLQVTGGFGYTNDFPAERHLRDARAYVVGGGSSEVLRNVIARELLRPFRAR